MPLLFYDVVAVGVVARVQWEGIPFSPPNTTKISSLIGYY